MLEIDREIAEKYDLEIKNIALYKDVYIINTSKGRKILKKTVLFPERIEFIHSVKEHLYHNDFKNIDRYLCTIEGKPYLTIDSDNFVITDVIDGYECNFDNRNELVNASKLLAKMHKASRGYIPPAGCTVKDELGKLPQYFAKRLDEIKRLRKTAKKGRSKFDWLFIEHFDYFYNMGENATRQINSSIYENLVASTRKEGIFCHHDYTHHNILISNDKYSLINFEFCCLELKVYDLANLLRRKMRRCDWDINEAKAIVKEYKSIETLSEEDYYVLKVILQFPQKFWRVVNKYYNSKRSWSEKSFVAKLQEVINEAEHHKKFMNRFEELML